VVDASVIVDFVLGAEAQQAIGARLATASIHAPAHLDAEVLSAIGRIHRAGQLTGRQALERLEDAADVPVTRHLLNPLVRGAWQRRQRLRLADALYVELATVLGVPLLTTDVALGRATRRAEVITVQ
jgi:predicted nucleic acid-binding protein